MDNDEYYNTGKIYTMDKYTIIIPTLWNSNRIFKLLDNLQNCEFVDEIILIDNNPSKSVLLNHSKIKYIKNEENVYVAKSWNIGVNEAKNEHIAILNDDINFNPNIFEITTNIEGFIGQASNNYHFDYNENPYLTPLLESRPWGWGCLILSQKKYWIDVPEELKVWYNDDFITIVNSAPKWILNNFTIKTEMSTTGDRPEFNEIKQQDTIHWKRILENYKK